MAGCNGIGVDLPCPECPPGENGVGVSGATINSKNELVISLTNGSTVNAGPLNVQPKLSISGENLEVCVGSACSTLALKDIFEAGAKLAAVPTIPIELCDGSVVGYGWCCSFAYYAGATIPMTDCDGNTHCYIMPSKTAIADTPIIVDCDSPQTVGFCASISG